jgi:hypothetical protein
MIEASRPKAIIATIDPALLSLYKKFRAQQRGGLVGYDAASCLAAAKTEILWNIYEHADLVRLRWEPDECADISWIDQDCFDDRYRSETLAQIERDGMWGLVGEYRVGDSWVTADSCWGFIGQDAHVYEQDIKSQTLEALRSR